MEYGNQTDIVEFLLRAGGDGSAAGDTRVIQTHISIVVLKGDSAWKLKRDIRLPYADFSTPERRLACCEQEVVLNRRTAPSLYVAARRIYRQPDGSLLWDQGTELADAVVEMQRFDEATLFSRMAAGGQLHRPLLSALASHIARFHAQADIHLGSGSANIAAILDLNEQSADMAATLGDAPVRELRAALRDGLAEHQALLDARGQAGKIRHCHGDLHLRNLCLVDGQPTLFDCIEFNTSLSIIDVLYDLAFLLMDLWHNGLQAEANWVMNRYLDESGDAGGLPLLPYFMALRASIRAQVLATQANMANVAQDDAVLAQAQAYLALARQLLQPGPPRLLAIGGLSGSGKSTLAAAIAHQLGPAPGARVLATDRIRKQMAGVSAETRLPTHTYTMESSQRVYAEQLAQAERALASGQAVVADAVFSREDERQAIAACASQVGAAFQGIWLETEPATLVARVQARHNDPSDATAAVVHTQLEGYQRPGDWQVLPASEPLSALTEQALNTLFGPPPWSDAPQGWNWLAQDADGCWYWYAVLPQLGLAGGIWRSPRRAQQWAAQGQPNPLWHESCQQRPDSDCNQANNAGV